MVTLKKFLNENKVTISNPQRFDLGYKIARIWDSKKMGIKSHAIENDFKVRVYPIEFLESKTVSKKIVKYLNNEFDNLSNSF